MAAPISAQRMVDLVGRKIEDVAHTRWTTAVKLQAIDGAVQQLLLDQARQRQDHDLDFVDLSVSEELNNAGTMTDSGQTIREWRVPDYVYEIRLIEDTTDENVPRVIPRYPLSQKEQYRNVAAGMFWVWSKGGDIRTRIGFVGELTGVDSLRVWFIRRVAPLHYGVLPNRTVAAVQVGCTNARLTFALASAATTVGRVVNRGRTYTGPSGLVSVSDVYVGAIVEFGTGAGVTVDGVTDEIRKLVSSSYIQVDDAPVAPDTGFHWTWVFDELLRLPINGASVNCAGFSYSLVPQIAPEHHELVALMAAIRCAEEAGGFRTMDALKGKMQDLYADFLNATQSRQSQTPEFVEVSDDHTIN